MDWSPQQLQALDAVSRWIKARDKPYFYLGGVAGTGKSTLARHFAEGVNGETLYASFTGKAASVMRSKGCAGARTIHSLIYKPREKSGDRLAALEAELQRLLRGLGDHPAADADPSVQRLHEDIAAEKDNVRRPHFELNIDSDLSGAALLILDECSMIGGQMVDDLFYFRVPILFLGDPAQLPPVKATGFFTRNEPDYCLTEIHRQALDNPIIRMSMDVREGRGLKYGQYDDSSVITVSEFRERRAEFQGQILVGKNETRRKANKRCREERGLGKTSPFPETGDRLVCLKNNREMGLWNGTIWDVMSSRGRSESGFDTQGLDIRSEDGMGLSVDAFEAPFLGQDVDHWSRREAEEFDYGYALTVHKGQGSQWDDVILIDESSCFRQDSMKWLYTGLTRAAKKIVVVR